MKQLLMAIALLLAALPAVGQTAEQPVADTSTQQVAPEPELQPHAQRPIPPTPPEASTPGHPGKAPASDRYRYDPSAKVGDPDLKGSKESNLEKGLKRINPNNVNYGGLLATWRIAGVQETIESLYFWIIVFLGGSLAITMAYVTWLLHEMDRRRHVAGSIITQLWNAHVFARGKALDAIDAHNRVVAELNAIDGLTKSDSNTGNAGVSAGSAASSLNSGSSDGALTVVATAQDAVAVAAELFERNLDASQKIAGPPPVVSAPIATVATKSPDENSAAVPLAVKAMQAQRVPEPLPADFGGANSLETLVSTPIQSQPIDSAAGEIDINDPQAVLQAYLAEKEARERVQAEAEEAAAQLLAKDAQLQAKDVQLTAKDGKIETLRLLTTRQANELKGVQGQ